MPKLILYRISFLLFFLEFFSSLSSGDTIFLSNLRDRIFSNNSLLENSSNIFSDEEKYVSNSELILASFIFFR